MDRYSMNFGKKERVLNYTCQTYQLSRPNKVGAVMALIRDCQPSSFDEWHNHGISKMLIPQEKIRRKSQSKVSMNWVNGCMQKLRKS